MKARNGKRAFMSRVKFDFITNLESVMHVYLKWNNIYFNLISGKKSESQEYID